MATATLDALARIKVDYDEAERTRINLYAGCNVASPAVERALTWGWGAMPAMGPPFAKDQPGTDHVSKLEQLVERQITDLFVASWAEARLPTCTLANAAIFHVFGGQGRLLVSPAAANGGHISARTGGTPEIAGMQVSPLPYDQKGFEIDDEAAAALVERERPAILFLGCSVAIGIDLPPRTIAAARAHSALVVYDASHVLGLIAGGCAPNPLDHGVDLVTASTYKSFGGPPGAVVFGRDRAIGERLKAVVCPTFSSNYDASRLAALSVSVSEASQFMPSYASAMIATAASLNEALRANGLDTMPRGMEAQRSHQILVPVGTRDEAKAAMERLEQQGIIVGINLMPPGDVHCLRIGTQILARRGYEDDDVGELAALVAGALNGGEVRSQVGALAVRRQALRFCLP